MSPKAVAIRTALKASMTIPVARFFPARQARPICTGTRAPRSIKVNMGAAMQHKKSGGTFLPDFCLGAISHAAPLAKSTANAI